MSILLLYYSRTGNNKHLAETLAEELCGELEEIIDPTDRHGIWGYLKSGYQSMRKIMVEIKPLIKQPKNYEHIIILSPIWTGTLTPAVRTLLVQHKKSLNKLHFVSVNGKGLKNKFVVSEVEKLIDKKAHNIMLISKKDFSEGVYLKEMERFIDSFQEQVAGA